MAETQEAAIPIGQIKLRSDFLKARSGARSHGRAFVLQGLARQDDDPQIRFGYTVTKKVGNSVERNRIKRRFREAVRQIGSSQFFPAKLKGHDVVVIAKRQALTLPYTQLVATLVKALEQLVANDRPKGQKRREKRGGKNSAGSKTAQNLSEAG